MPHNELLPPRPITIADADDASVAALAASAGVHPIVARVLLRRGVDDVEKAARFLAPDLARDWRDPDELPGMPECADAVAQAVRKKRRIVVFGDFDVDGLTAAAVACRGLRELGGTAEAVVPHRFDEGYGLTDAAVTRVLTMDPELVITVDCGIGSAEEVARLCAAGVDVVVTDHHEPAGSVPEGVPVCDPKLASCGFDELAGAGVALKLVAAVGARLGRPDAWRDLTDLAALGTVGDVVPLRDENRALVADGLARTRRAPRACIAALCEAAGADASSLTSERIAFGLAPRLNAAGRIADPAEALDLLLTDDAAHARKQASSLDGYNTVRQTAEADLTEQALRQAAERWHPGCRVLVLAGDAWHEGVRGIVASRVAGHYGVPTLVFTVDGGEARGSGRSVADVDLHAALSACGAILTRFGGHAAAVGATLPADRLDALTSALQSALEAVPEAAFARTLVADAPVALEQATKGLAHELDALEPYGHGNERPLLAARGVFMRARARVGHGADHLKFDAYDGVATVPAIAFRCPEIASLATTETAVDLAFSLETSTWQGRERVQLMVRRIESAAPGATAASELVESLFAQAESICARGEYEGIADAASFHTKLAGVTFEGRQDVVARLAPGTVLRIRREPDNPFDANAVALIEPEGAQVGYFNRRLAAAIAPALDAGVAYGVSVTEITGGEDGECSGVNVLVEQTGGSETGAVDAARGRALRERLAAASPDERAAEIAAALIGSREPHPAQREALTHLAAGRSCLAVMATGRGKSFIFQAHAARIAIASGQASVLVYPLRALVADQAFHLESSFARLGLSVRLITGETSLTDRDSLFAALRDGEVDVMLTTPEFLQRNAERFGASGRVRFLVVDEAHHVGLARSGHRPAYAQLDEVRDALGDPTVCAVTATADRQVADVVCTTLGIDELVCDPTRRENLHVADRRGMSDKIAHLCALAARDEKLIVYVNSRDQSVEIARRLRRSSARLEGRCAFYNGGMTRAQRQAVETAFREGDLTAVVATSAFGEGVDIPDVRHVALFHLPFNRVEFNQMCGRAGRDGAAATVHLLFGERDGKVNDLILESSAPDMGDLRALYALLRARAQASGDGWVEATNAELATDVKQRHPRARINDRGVSTGLGVFREMGLVSGEGTGAYRRLSLCPVDGKVDLTASVRYSEGLQEVEEFGAFRSWVLTAPADDLLAAIDRPILPA